MAKTQLTLSNSERILQLLKMNGPATAKQLAEQLAMTAMGARQHLLQLQKSGVVDNYHKSEKVGRPTQYWQLTTKANDKFTDSHAQLATQLIEQVVDVYGAEGLAKIVAGREQKVLSQYLQAIGKAGSIEERLQILTELRSAEGYMANWEKNGDSYLFVENHCPICAAAATCQNLCVSEYNLLDKCFEGYASIDRVEHILGGERRCTYRITPHA